MRLRMPYNICLMLERFLERCPWCLAVVAVLLKLFRLLDKAVLFANQCPSKLRFMPMLSDEAIVVWDNAYKFSLDLTAVVVLAMLLSPIIPLAFGKLRTVLVMLLFALPCILIDPQAWIPREVTFPIADQVRTARNNVKRRAEALGRGRDDYCRTPIHMMEQRVWILQNDRYHIEKFPSARGLSEYALIDDQWHPPKNSRYAPGGRVVLENIVKWHDCGDRLRAVLKDGKCCELIYESGKLIRCVEEEVK